MAFNQLYFYSKIVNLVSDYNSYETLKRVPSGYNKKIIKWLQRLEKQGVISHPTYYRLYLGDCISYILYIAFPKSTMKVPC